MAFFYFRLENARFFKAPASPLQNLDLSLTIHRHVWAMANGVINDYQYLVARHAPIDDALLSHRYFTVEALTKPPWSLTGEAGLCSKCEVAFFYFRLENARFLKAPASPLQTNDLSLTTLWYVAACRARYLPIISISSPDDSPMTLQGTEVSAFYYFSPGLCPT